MKNRSIRPIRLNTGVCCGLLLPDAVKLGLYCLVSRIPWFAWVLFITLLS